MKITETIPTLSISDWIKPHRVALVSLWLLTTVAYVIMLSIGVRDTYGFQFERNALQVAYVATLLWYLCRIGPDISQLPEIHPPSFLQKRYLRWIPVLIIVILFALTAISDDGFEILQLLMLVALWPVLIIWRREIRLRFGVQSVVVAAIALAAGLPMIQNGVVSEAGYLYTILVVPMYIAGGLMLFQTKLGGIQLLTKPYGSALRSFLRGCLLFAPLGLANAAGGSPPGSDFTWVSEWWMPLSLPLWSGIVEETWFRLFVVGLVYWLLRPAFQRNPVLAVLFTVLFSGITFGLGHGRTLERFLTTGMLYGLPYAVIFARRDWEHAVGAHYMVNMIPWMMVFLET